MDQLKRMSVLTPLALHRHDLFHIEKILRKHIDCCGADMLITAIEHGHVISGMPFHSFDDLYREDHLPHKTDELTIEAREISPQRELVKDAKIFIGNRMAYLRVFSKDDPEWVESTFNELNDFLKSRTVWFSFLARAMPPINNSSILISILLTLMALLTGVTQALVFPVIIVSSALMLLSANLQGKLYAVGRVNLHHHKEDLRPNYERYVIWIYLLVVISCVTGAIAMNWDGLSKFS